MKQKLQKSQIQRKALWNEIAENKWYVLFFIIISTFLIYSGSFNVPFQFDDHNQITFRESVHSLDYFKNIDNWLKINERPVSFFTIALNYSLHGEKVFGYHLFNLIIHVLTGFFLFLLINVFTKYSKVYFNNPLLSLIITLFFLLQPVQTQSVTYIIQRMSALAGLFVVISVLLYTIGRLNFFKGEGKIKPVFFILLAFLFGIIGSLSKQNAIIFPLIFLLIEIFFIRNYDGKICKTYVIAFAGALITVFVIGISIYGIPAETDKISPLNYLATQMYVIPRYFGMMLVPIGLSIDHGVKIADGFLNFKVISGIFILMAILAYGFFMLKKSPLVTYGILWIFITLLVESSIIPITDPMFDQRMYLPLAGFSIALFASLDFFLFSKKPSFLKPIAIGILILMSITTVARNVVWKDRISLWTEVTERYPDYFRGWFSLGKMYKESGDENILKTIESFEKAKQLAPDNEEVIAELGLHYLKAGQGLKAVENYTKLLNSKDKNFRVQSKKVLAAYNISIEEHQKGLFYMQEVLKDIPSDENANKSIFGFYFDRKDYPKAIETANEWIKNSPSSSEAYFYKGKAYFTSNDRFNAKQNLKKSLDINPNNVEAMLLYANSCVNTFDYDEAIIFLEKAYSITNDKSIPGHIQMIKQLKAQQKK